MNVFELRQELLSSYAAYIRSFIQIRDPLIRDKVEAELNSGLLWPETLIQLNPSFEPGRTINELVDEGILDTGCRKVFRIKPDRRSEGRPLRLHRHQEEAVRVARGGSNYVLTTGTGSGKSLSYIVPVVDHVLRRGAGRGVQAIVVYPMNALANSQYRELEKFLHHGFPDGRGPVRFACYTGQITWSGPPRSESSSPAARSSFPPGDSTRTRRLTTRPSSTLGRTATLRRMAATSIFRHEEGLGCTSAGGRPSRTCRRP
jgi:hypothetical protein